MINLHRFTIKIAGESGQGVNSVGEMVAKSLKESGLYSFGYREYPSLIKGGYSCHQIDIADTPIQSPSASTDLLIGMSRTSVHKYLPTVRDHGIVVHSVTQLVLSQEEQDLLAAKQITISYVPAYQLAFEAGGTAIMSNTVLIGVLWRVLGLELAPVKQVLEREFANKSAVIAPNLACLERGFKEPLAEVQPVTLPFTIAPKREADALMTGNQIIALGAVAAGVRAYYAYPMTPTSSILSYLASIYHQTGMLVKQVEDEISVAQMAIGSMFMGTRALVSTSGGGFDLMTESVSMSGMTETPFVCILGQRPGPATGLPTWTSASDLNLAIYSGHGEYSRCVIAVSDPASCYIEIQNAFNIAEKFQLPVIVLTDKQIAESLFQFESLPVDVPINRHLVSQAECERLEASDRFKITDNGISPRWLPGQTDATFDANSDEHLPDGSLTEEAEPTLQMYDKRLRKLDTLVAELPEPELFGPPQAQATFVGWGSVKNSVLDGLILWNQAHPERPINYLHYTYVFPLKTGVLEQLINQHRPLILIENNALGQLGGLITQQTGYLFSQKFLKYDGRPFFIEDIVNYLDQQFGS